ncbi:MAG: NUDIX hydrolase [Rhodovarius sp.]|nr:NUDIX hydrolase [Rhodovarius sp.]
MAADPLRERLSSPPPGGWQVLSRHIVLAHRFLTVAAERVQTSAGTVIDPWWILHFPDWVMVVPITADGRLVLIRQWRQGVRQHVIEVPGGAMEEGDDDPCQAAARELREETGWQAARLSVVGHLWADPARNANRCHVVLAEGCREAGPPALDPGEQIEAFTVPLAEAEAMLRDGRIESAIHAAALLRGLAAAGEIGGASR